MRAKKNERARGRHARSVSLSRARSFLRLFIFQRLYYSMNTCSHCAKEWRRNLSDLFDDTLSRSAQLRFVREYYGFASGAREPQVELSN